MPFKPGDLVTVDFPGVTGIKRRPAVVLSSATYHALRPDTVVGLITTRTSGLGATDYELEDWVAEAYGLPQFSAVLSLPCPLPLI